LKKRERRNIP